MDNKSSRNENFYFFVFVYFPRKQLRIVVVRTLVNGWKKMNGRHPIGHESLSLNIIIIVIIIIECWSAFWVLKLQLRKSSTHEVIYAKPENQWNSIRESWAHVRVCVCLHKFSVLYKLILQHFNLFYILLLLSSNVLHPFIFWTLLILLARILTPMLFIQLE